MTRHSIPEYLMRARAETSFARVRFAAILLCVLLVYWPFVPPTPQDISWTAGVYVAVGIALATIVAGRPLWAAWSMLAGGLLGVAAMPTVYDYGGSWSEQVANLSTMMIAASLCGAFIGLGLAYAASTNPFQGAL